MFVKVCLECLLNSLNACACWPLHCPSSGTATTSSERAEPWAPSALALTRGSRVGTFPSLSPRLLGFPSKQCRQRRLAETEQDPTATPHKSTKKPGEQGPCAPRPPGRSLSVLCPLPNPPRFHSKMKLIPPSRTPPPQFVVTPFANGDFSL